MLLLLFSNQPAPSQVGYANLSLSVADLWPPLNSTSEADAVYWTADELYGWMDEAAKKFALTTGAFVDYDTSVATVAGTPTYALPALTIDPIQVDLASITLVPRNAQEAEAKSTDYLTEQDQPVAFMLDEEGLEKIRLIPVPDNGPETLGITRTRLPDAISVSAAVIPVPPTMRDYFTLSALARARAKESPGSMDEVVAWLEQVAGYYEQVGKVLWGIG